MTQRVIHRPARTSRPDADLHPVQLLAPPTLPDAGAGLQGVMQILMPILGGVGSLIMIVANRNPVMLIAGGIMLAATIAGGIVMFIAQRTGAGKRAADLRRRYLDYLDRVRTDLVSATARQRTAALARHPDPAELTESARDPLRLWERRSANADFLVVRVGTGSAPLWATVSAAASRDPLAEPDVVTAAAIHRIVERDRMVTGMPVAVPLAGRVSVIGPPSAVRRTVTAALTQLVTLHGPQEVRVVSCVPRRAAGWLDWLKWLPHSLSDDEVDGTAPARLAAGHPDDLAALLGPELARRTAEAARTGRLQRADPARYGPALVVLVDSTSAPAFDPTARLPPDLSPAALGVHVVSLVTRPSDELALIDVRLRCDENTVTVEDLRPPADEQADRRQVQGAVSGSADSIPAAELQALCRELSGVRMVEETANAAPMESTLTLGDLVGVADPAAFEPAATWAPRSPEEFLRVPFALGPAGDKVFLDLKEPALGGMGPHGLCVGATGSGKSEVLRTLVLTLAISHAPERLSMVLVDYKGGATFAGLESLPHCAAMISNLSDDAGLVDRLHDALFGEMKRRQRMLADAGNLPHVTEYSRRRDAGDPACAAPLPDLFVVIDEFGELLTAKPDFIELFLAIGRIGRSIGVHLLLASQRLEEGRLRGLESFLSYRLGLRTFNAGESRTVLGVPDAYELPPIPGSGYLKVDTTVFRRFKAGYVSATYRPPVTGGTSIDIEPVAAPFPLFNDTARYLAALAPDHAAAAPIPEEAVAPTVLDVAVSQLARAGRPVAQIWLPPLASRLELDQVAGPVIIDPDVGLRFPGSLPAGSLPGGRHSAVPTGALRVVLGLVDRPAVQSQDPLVVDLASSGGHLAILGAPQSGKSTLLRTLVVSAALSHRPGEVSFYCLDLGGGALRLLDRLPHVAGVAPRLDADRVRRTVAEVATALAEREVLFGRRGLDSVEMMREQWRAGRLQDLAAADIFLVVDNYPVLRSDFDDLTESLQDLATRGPGYGIHLILTSGRWADIRMQLQATLGSRMELRLNEPAESSLDRKAAQNLRADSPGRCLIAGPFQAQICLPVVAALRPAVPGDPVATGERGADEVTPGSTEQLVQAITASWSGPSVPPIRMLPTLVDHNELLRLAGDRPGVVVGVDESALQPVALDFRGADQHLLVIGDAETGKTSLLRLVIGDLTRGFDDQQVVFAVFDVRRTLLDVVPADYLGAYAGTAQVAAGMAAGVAAELRKRLPPDDVTAAQLRERSWWRGPDIYVVVDDWDLLSAGGPGPLAPFIEFLPQARDLGLHLIVCRRSGGAGRAMYEPVLQRMREVGATGLLLSGDRQEGPLYPGIHLSVQPPGRGHLVRRGRAPQLVQLAFRPESY